MNNWRLLLALVALFQPIASFTERNIFDGRQQCCGRETDSFPRDTTSSTYGPHRFTDNSSPHQRLTRDDAREDRRLELRQRDIAYSTRRSTDRSLRDIREGSSDRLSITSRSNRVDVRYERVVNDENRNRQLNSERRQVNVRNIRDVDADPSRRVISHVARHSDTRYDVRTRALSSGKILSRDNIRINSFDNENSYRERRQAHSGEVPRVTATRHTLNKIRQMREEVSNGINNNRQNNVRERMSSVPRESLSRPEVRRNMDDNRELRERVRLVRERSNSEFSIGERIHDVNRRENSKYDDRKQIRQRVDDRRHLSSERIDERREKRSNDLRQFRERINDNTERRLSGERMIKNDRIVREYDTTDMNVRAERRSQSHSLLNSERIDERRERRSNDLRQSREQINDNTERRFAEKRMGKYERIAREYDVTDKNVRADRYIESRRLLDSERIDERREKRSNDFRQSRERIIDNTERRFSEERRGNNERIIREYDATDKNVRADRHIQSRLHFNTERIQGKREKRSNDVREFKERINDNIDRRVSEERTGKSERTVREYDRTNMNIRADRHIQSRHDIRYRERMFSEFRGDQLTSERRGESRVTRRISSPKQVDRITNRNVRSDEFARGRDDSRRQIEYRNKMEIRERDSNNLSRNMDSVRNRELTMNKMANEGESVTNWKYVLYTLQGLYMCGLLMQMLMPNAGKKSNKIKLRWWPFATQELIKVD